MNREILFKAKRKDDGGWVEGYYISGMKLPGYDGIQDFIIEKNGDYYAIDINTFCQYTGLTDKNIWENDIVRNKKGDIGVVQWFEEHAAFMIWNKTKNCVCYLAENDFSKIEVIGNIFDNPDLLEVD